MELKNLLAVSKRMKKRKGVYFSIDAVIALIVLFSAFFLIFNVNYFSSHKLQVQENSYRKLNMISEDALQVMSKKSLSSLSKSKRGYLINETSLTSQDLDKSVLDGIVLLWSLQNKSGENFDASVNLTQTQISQLIPEGYNYSLSIEDPSGNSYLVYNSFNKSKLDMLTSSSRVLSGYKKNVSSEGYVSKALLSEVKKEESKYSYFGGYVGEGVVYKNLSLPEFDSIVNFTIEADTSGNFTLKINDNFSGNYSSTSGNMSPDSFSVCSTNHDSQRCNLFQPGNNLIEFNLTGSDRYIGGGYIKVSYNLSDYSFSPEADIERYRLPGIDGTVNLYSSFDVPGNLTDVDIRLHYWNNMTLNDTVAPIFLKIGSQEVYWSNQTGEIDEYITDPALNLSALSESTIPFRLGTREVNMTKGIGGGDAVLITDVSGSMRNCDVLANCTSGICDTSDPCHRERMEVAKEVDKDFVEGMLNHSGSNVGLVSYENVVRNYHDLSDNEDSLDSEIGGYFDEGGTCISCGEEKSINMLEDSHMLTDTIIPKESKWRYSTKEEENWTETNFDDLSWNSGDAILGFETETYSPHVETTIKSNEQAYNVSDFEVIEGSASGTVNQIQLADGNYLNITADEMEVSWFQTSQEELQENSLSGTVAERPGIVRLAFRQDRSSRSCSDVWGFDCTVDQDNEGDNTFDSCSSGSGDGWVANVEGTVVNATYSKQSRQVEIGCTYDPYYWSNSFRSYYHIYYRSSPTENWQLVESGANNQDSPVEITETVKLDNKTGEHQFRCSIDYNEDDGDGCADQGSYYDNDDVNLFVEHVPNGSVTAKAFDAGLEVNWSEINWNEEVSSDTDIEMSVSTSQDGTSWSSWTTKTNGENINSESRYIRWRSNLSTQDTSQTPELEKVNITYPGFKSEVRLNSTEVTQGVSLSSLLYLSSNTTGVHSLEIYNFQTNSWESKGCDQAAVGSQSEKLWCNRTSNLSSYLNNNITLIKMKSKSSKPMLTRLDLAKFFSADKAEEYFFRKNFELENTKINYANLHVLSDDRAEVYLNGNLIDNDTQQHQAKYWNRPSTLFREDFEAGLDDWSVTQGSLGDEIELSSGCTYSSPSQALVEKGNEAILESKSFDLSAKDSAKLSYWVIQGYDDSNCEDPDSGEDLIVEYLTSGSNWVELKTHPGNGNDPSTGSGSNYSFVLPQDALHSNSKVRFHYTGGSGNDYDCWAVDDVKLTSELGVPSSLFKGGKNSLAVKLHNNDSESAKFDLMLDMNRNKTRVKAMLVMSDGEANYCLGGHCSTSEAKQEAIDKACEARRKGLDVYAVAFGDSADETTLKKVACWNCTSGDWISSNCTNSSHPDAHYFKGSKAEELKKIYQGIADRIGRAIFKAQSINLTGFEADNQLYSDSYFKLNYSSSQDLEFGKFSLTQQTDQFGGAIESPKNFTFSVPDETEVIEAKATSYSGSYWTDSLKINSSGGLDTVYNLSKFGSNYQRLGDPYRIRIPPDKVQEGSSNKIQMDTAISPTETRGASPNNSIIYKLLIDGSVGFGNTFEKAEGGTTTFESEFGDIKVKAGNETDQWNASNDAVDDAVERLINELDVDQDGKIDFKLESEDMSIDDISVGGVPWLWGPVKVKLEVWKE